MKAKFLFLDRDGVINERLPGAYVQKVEEFKFAEASLEALSLLSKRFERIIVVTNQQGIGKGLMTEADLSRIHAFLEEEVTKHGGRLDAIYHCPSLAADKDIFRKPGPGMALQAKRDFPEIDFGASVMVGDSISDMRFGKRLGMKTIMIESNPKQVKSSSMLEVDQWYDSLLAFTNSLP